VNQKRVHSLYRLEELNLRIQGKKKRIRTLQIPDVPRQPFSFKLFAWCGLSKTAKERKDAFLNRIKKNSGDILNEKNKSHNGKELLNENFLM
jgi:hypothetical protein